MLNFLAYSIKQKFPQALNTLVGILLLRKWLSAYFPDFFFVVALTGAGAAIGAAAAGAVLVAAVAGATGAFASAAFSAAFGFTSPLIDNTICGVSELLITVTVLEKLPGRPCELKEAVTLPVLPGITGSFVQSGVVQPHEACAFEITTGAVPVFVNSKVCVA